MSRADLKDSSQAHLYTAAFLIAKANIEAGIPWRIETMQTDFPVLAEQIGQDSVSLVRQVQDGNGEGFLARFLSTP